MTADELRAVLQEIRRARYLDGDDGDLTLEDPIYLTRAEWDAMRVDPSILKVPEYQASLVGNPTGFYGLRVVIDDRKGIDRQRRWAGELAARASDDAGAVDE